MKIHFESPAFIDEVARVTARVRGTLARAIDTTALRHFQLKIAFRNECMNFVPPINLVASQARSRQSDEASNGEMSNEKKLGLVTEKRERREKKR